MERQETELEIEAKELEIKINNLEAELNNMSNSFELNQKLLKIQHKFMLGYLDILKERIEREEK